jgi:hypothetical protein
VSIAGEPSSAEANWWRRPVRFALTVLVFALVGSLIGGAITIVGYVIFGFHITVPGQAGWMILAAMIYALWRAYPIGLVPAAGVGAIIAVRDRFRGSSLAEAALIGGGIGVLWALFVSGRDYGNLFTVLVIIASLVAAAACWKLTRWLRRFG